MRSEKEVYDIVLNFCKKQTNAFAWLLWKDLEQIQIFRLMIFRIFDITFFVTDMDSFTSDDKWLDIFGERLILQKAGRIWNYFQL